MKTPIGIIFGAYCSTFFIGFVAFILQLLFPWVESKENTVYFLSVDFTRNSTIFIWILACFLLMHKERLPEDIQKHLDVLLYVGLAVAFLDGVKDTIAYTSNLYIWKEYYIVKLVVRFYIFVLAYKRVKKEKINYPTLFRWN